MRDLVVVSAIAVAWAAQPAFAQSAPSAPAPAANPGEPVVLMAPSWRPAPKPPVNRAPFLPMPGPDFANSRSYVAQYQQVQEFGRCAANISGERSRELLESAPNTPIERNEVRRVSLLGRGCQSYGVVAPIVFLRAGVAEALYKKLPTSVALHATGATGTDVAAFSTAEVMRSKARLADDRLFTTLANCYAMAAPRQVRDLLYSKHGTAAEREAMNAVINGAPSCATGKQISSAGGTSFLRAYIAESAYRWATFHEMTRGHRQQG